MKTTIRRVLRQLQAVRTAWQILTLAPEQWSDRFYGKVQAGFLEVLEARINLYLETSPEAAQRVEALLQAAQVQSSETNPVLDPMIRVAVLFKQLRQATQSEPTLKNLRCGNSGIDLQMRHWAVPLLMHSLNQFLIDHDPPNYQTIAIANAAISPEHKLGEIILVKKSGETPAEKAFRLEQEVIKLRSQLEALSPS